MLISVVVPCFNEQEVIEETNRRLNNVFGSMKGYDYEILYVNDGSQDRTLDSLKKISLDNKKCKVISFSRNFGHQIAVTAGIENAKGDITVLIDADLQDPPEIVPDMIEKLIDGYDVVYGRRVDRDGETRFKKITATLFYRVMSKLSDTKLPIDAGDFRVMRKSVTDELKRMPEKHRYLRGMISWVGFRQVEYPYNRSARFAGQTKYSLKKMLSFAMDGLISFTTKPLKLAIYFGFICSFIASLGIFYVIGVRLFTNSWVSGWTTMILAVLFIGGIQILILGIIGEYIGRIYEQSKGRPLFVIDEFINDN